MSKHALFKNKYRVDPARLQHHDYRTVGAYFITICTQNRYPYFGEIRSQNMVLNSFGSLVSSYWEEIPAHFPHVELDVFVVMLNHIHGIILIVGDVVRLDNDGIARKGDGSRGRDVVMGRDVATGRDVAVQRLYGNGNPKNKNESMARISPKPGSISTIIRSFKSVCTREINKIKPEYFGWQARFYDHVIRNEQAYQNIQNYIINNPKDWSEDRFHLEKQ